jgi:uncharacterized protein YbdZ (MbtH family)
VLQTKLDVKAVNEKLAIQLVNTLNGKVGVMNPQNIANTLNALSWLDVVAGAMSPAGWDAVAKAVERTATLPAGWDAVAKAAERTAPTMNEQDVANTLNALSKVGAAASAMSPAGWSAMAKVAERTAPTMNAQNAANTFSALSKLDAAASAMSPAGWDAVARAAERTAPTMNAQECAITLDALKRSKSIKALKGISIKREIFHKRK